MKDEIIISQGKRSLWHNILAAFFYTVAISCIILFFYDLIFFFDEINARNEARYLQIAIFSAGTAIYFSLTQSYHFDFKNSQYKHEHALIMFKIGKWKNLPPLEYVSVFKKDDDFYQVNLWYVGNKHFKIYQMYDGEEALDVGKKLAETLQIDLLDSRIANDSKWIEL